MKVNRFTLIMTILFSLLFLLLFVLIIDKLYENEVLCKSELNNPSAFYTFNKNVPEGYIQCCYMVYNEFNIGTEFCKGVKKS